MAYILNLPLFDEVADFRHYLGDAFPKHASDVEDEGHPTAVLILAKLNPSSTALGLPFDVGIEAGEGLFHVPTIDLGSVWASSFSRDDGQT